VVFAATGARPGRANPADGIGTATVSAVSAARQDYEQFSNGDVQGVPPEAKTDELNANAWTFQREGGDQKYDVLKK
jgi:hypothetical protein